MRQVEVHKVMQGSGMTLRFVIILVIILCISLTFQESISVCTWTLLASVQYKEIRGLWL